MKTNKDLTKYDSFNNYNHLLVLITEHFPVKQLNERVCCCSTLVNKLKLILDAVEKEFNEIQNKEVFPMFAPISFYLLYLLSNEIL